MANITITNNDLGGVELEGAVCQDELITFGGADVLAPGTILARDSSTLKLVIFVKGGSTNGNGVPKAVLTYPVVSTGIGDVKSRVLVKGRVNRERLIIDAQGDGSAVDAAVLDGLRLYGIVPSRVDQLAEYDNPQ
jgi:hypothetical protein